MPPRQRAVRAIDRFFETEAAEAELRRWSRTCSAMLCDHFGL